MVVLLVGGGSSRLMDAMINKLNKCGHRVYLLTGKKESHFTYPRVFERYDFPYDSDSMKEIFESIRPDVTIFLGAYDTNYTWEYTRKESVQYTADLTNILSAYSVCRRGRFIYLSSQEVYGKSYIDDIPEEEASSAKNFRSMAIAQGEDICRTYKKTQDMDMAVLRLDHFYAVPKKGEQQYNPCYRMMVEALKNGKISANKKNQFSMIYLDDVVEYIYRIMEAEEPGHMVYNISSNYVISQMDLAEMIQKYMKEKIEVADATVGERFRLVLNGKRYREEFDQKIFIDYENGVKRTVEYMEKHSETYLKNQKETTQFSRRIWNNIKIIAKLLVPYIENIVCFIPFFMLNNRAVGSQYFDRLDFYLLYVLLFAIVYGQQQAVFSGLLATAGYCFRQMYQQSGFEVLLNYNTYVWMAQIFILGMVVGYMRDQLHFVRHEDEEEIGYLNGQIDDIADINDSNVRMKHTFETQIVNHKDSLGKIYSITSKLDQYEPEEVLFYAAQILEQLMDSNDIAIYSVANGDYARLFSFTSETAKKMGNSIHYSAMTEMYEELKDDRVYINKNMNPDYPLMANAIYSEDEIQIILMIWGIPWERMNLAEANRLRVTSYLIQNAVVRANRYLDALREDRYLEGTKILGKDAFFHLVTAFLNAKNDGLTECTLLKLDIKKKKFQTKSALLEKNLRRSDYLGIINGELYALLTNTNEENASYVIRRFEEIGCSSTIAGREVVEC